jgi:penicillin-insensitive murein endopeptidase
LILLALDPAVAKQWQALRLPTPGPALSIGKCSNGCLQGAATLPASGRGYEVIRLGRNRRYGHPALIAYVKRLGKAAKKAKAGLVVVGDLSQPRGGPTPTGHRSHQTGLDADIGYVAPAGMRAGHLSSREREQAGWTVVFDKKTHEKTALWSEKVPDLLALAAADPAVDRIFVEAGIKKLMCEGPHAKAPWQGRLRPWFAHDDHFHVRLKCPTDSPQCKPQDPPPDDGCGPSLAWWLGDTAAARPKKKETDTEPPPSSPAMPDACTALLTRTKRKQERRSPASGSPSPQPSPASGQLSQGSPPPLPSPASGQLSQGSPSP